MKQLWMLVGGNGAGKSTFYRTQLKSLGMPFVNTDDIARDVFPNAPEEHSHEAAKLAENLRNNLLEQGKNFCFETVFSHPSKIDFVAKAKALGYQVVLVFIYLEQSEMPHTVQNVLNALPLCDDVWLLDNSSACNPFIKVLRIRANELQQFVEVLPQWAAPFGQQ